MLNRQGLGDNTAHPISTVENEIIVSIPGAGSHILDPPGLGEILPWFQFGSIRYGDILDEGGNCCSNSRAVRHIVPGYRALRHQASRKIIFRYFVAVGSVIAACYKNPISVHFGCQEITQVELSSGLGPGIFLDPKLGDIAID